MREMFKRRLAKLEAQKCDHSVIQIFFTPPEVKDDNITGFQCGKAYIEREAGEPLETLEKRVAAANLGFAVARICVEVN